jgi:NAD(P)-dependent dehydrogenase (short-subunit alcohol dehydrogenase family)
MLQLRFAKLSANPPFSVSLSISYLICAQTLGTCSENRVHPGFPFQDSSWPLSSKAMLIEYSAVNNAGIGSGATILEGSEAFIRKTFEVNTMSHFWMVREFLPAMIKVNHGHVVTIASMASFILHAGNTDYAGSKASALAFHEGLSVELRSRYKAPNVRTT